jgi:hypothetical protein
VKSIQLYIDEDSCSEALIRGLRTRGWNVRTVHEAQLAGRTGEEQLDRAAAEGRVLLTSNTRDFCRLHQEWMKAEKHHAGIICIPQNLGVGAILRQLLPLALATAPDAMVNRVVFLGSHA